MTPPCAVPSAPRYGGGRWARTNLTSRGAAALSVPEICFRHKSAESEGRGSAPLPSPPPAPSVPDRPLSVRGPGGAEAAERGLDGLRLPPERRFRELFLCSGESNDTLKRRTPGAPTTRRPVPRSSRSVPAEGSGCGRGAAPHSAAAAGSSFCSGNSVGNGNGKISSLALTPQPLTGRSQLPPSSGFRFAPRGGAEGSRARGPGGGR